MGNVVVVGSQWGDEGKGKIVDWLCEKADIVVRFQGGHNAGHTIVVDDVQYKLSLLPSGVVRGGKMGMIGNGVVIDPNALLEEIDRIKKQGIVISPDNLKIAHNATLILPVHQQLDALREDSAGESARIGTTRRGIGPAYEDKVGRRAIRVMDLENEKTLKDKVERMLTHHNALLRGFKKDEIKNEEIMDGLKKIRDDILPFCAPVGAMLEDADKNNKKILFEGAQGCMLDVDHGTYPFVTSSNVVSAQAATGSGVGAQALDFVLGITKAYTTRVGSGPFPTEQDNEIGQLLGEKGKEFGTVTGRKRRCGWFDSVLVRHAVRVNGINGIALTKLDVMDEMDEIKICIGYQINGKKINYLKQGLNIESQEQKQNNIKPIYKKMKGWKTQTKGIKNLKQLPKQAREYIKTIEELCQVDVSLISTSAHRQDTILISDPFKKIRNKNKKWWTIYR